MNDCVEVRTDDPFFEQQLQDALRIALSGRTAIVVQPARYTARGTLTLLVAQVPADRAYQVRMPGNELHFDGTRGSVRVYSADHALYDPVRKCVRGYPHGLPTFLHPELEEQ